MPKRLTKKLYRVFLCDKLASLDDMARDPTPVTRETHLNFIRLQAELTKELYKLDNDLNGGTVVMFTAPKE